MDTRQYLTRSELEKASKRYQLNDNELQRTAELIGYIIGSMDGEQAQEASAEIAAVQLERLADAIGVNLKRGAFGYMIGRAAENAAPLEEAPPVA